MPWCETMRQKTSRAMLEQIYGQMQRCTLIGFLIYIYVRKSTKWFIFLIPFFRQTTKFVSQNARKDVVLFRNLLRGRIVNTFAKFANPGIVGKSSLRFLSKNVIGRNKSLFVRPSTKRIAKRSLKKNASRDKTRNVWTCHRRNANPWHEKDAIRNPCRYRFQESLFLISRKNYVLPFFWRNVAWWMFQTVRKKKLWLISNVRPSTLWTATSFPGTRGPQTTATSRTIATTNPSRSASPWWKG